LAFKFVKAVLHHHEAGVLLFPLMFLVQPFFLVPEPSRVERREGAKVLSIDSAHEGRRRTYMIDIRSMVDEKED